MSDADKNIVITPATGNASADPSIVLTGANNVPITLRVLSDGEIAFEGNSGQLFSIADDMTGTIFSVNDISGIPSIEVLDDGTIKFAEFGGTVEIPEPTANNHPTTKLYVDTADQGLSSNISNVQNSVSSLSSNLSSLSNTVAALTTNSLTDVTTSNVQNNEFLLYNSNTSVYENKAFDAQYMTFQYADGGSPDTTLRLHVSVDGGLVQIPVQPG